MYIVRAALFVTYSIYFKSEKMVKLMVDHDAHYHNQDTGYWIQFREWNENVVLKVMVKYRQSQKLEIIDTV